MTLRGWIVPAVLSALLCAGAFTLPDAAHAQVSVREQNLAYSALEEDRRAAETPAEMAAIIPAYDALAAEGHARSAFRLGNIFTRGTLVEADTARGIAYLRQAAELGFDEAWRYLGDALLEDGQTDQALEAFNRAETAGISGYEITVARAHLQRDFGPASDPRKGIALLEQLAQQNDPRAQIELAKALANPSYGVADFERARLILEPLGDAGDAEALFQLARLYRSGLGVDRSIPRANELYLASAEAGNGRALIEAADMERRRGLLSTARATLQRAMDENVPDADLAFARALVENHFDNDADRPRGVAILKTGVDQGRLPHALLAMDLLSDWRQFSMNTQQLLDIGEAAADDGDTRAAQTLLRFVRERRGLVPSARQLQADYITRYGDILPADVLAAERVLLTLDRNRGRNVGVPVLEQLNTLSDSEYNSALVAVARENENAYTYVLQSELRRLGLYGGRLSGNMTPATLRAVLQLCRDGGYFEECEDGPLASTAVQLVVATLTDKRAPRP